MSLHLKLKPLIICIVILGITMSLGVERASSYHGDPNLPHYDPENLADDVAPLRPAIKWRYEHDHMDEEPSSLYSQRRSSDRDLDDLDDDDDERDDYVRSASSPQARYDDDIAYDESPKAMKDGDDIESFFDKNLGPEANPDSERRSAEEENPEPPAILGAAVKAEIDRYDVAASSPLASIFHSLFNPQKRPLIITTEDTSQSDQSSNGGRGRQHSLGITIGPSSSTSSSNPATASSNVMRNPNVQMAQMNSGSANSQRLQASYITPIAAPSSAYDKTSGQSSADEEQYQPPVRTIYITRRPTGNEMQSGVNNQYQPHQYQAYVPQSQNLDHQPSDAYWRSAARPYGGVGGGGSEQAEQADYSRYPAVAASYAHQREPQQQADGDDEQTSVTFGLSFGSAQPGSSSESSSADEPSEGSGEDQTSVDEQTYETPTYLPASRNQYMGRGPASAQQVYTYGRPMFSPGYVSPRPQAASVIQQQAPFHGARYHKDPSESVVQPVNYGLQQHSTNTAPMTEGTSKDSQWAKERQQLLANLDNQIKINTYIRQKENQVRTFPAAGMPIGAQHLTSNRQSVIQRVNKNTDNDVDMYRSYHSEVDPYKSFTTTSQTVSEPATGNEQLQGNGGVPAAATSQVSVNDDDKLRHDSLSSSGSVRIPSQESGDSDGQSASNSNDDRKNLLTGPVEHVDSQRLQLQQLAVGDSNHQADDSKVSHVRVRRDDSEERENEDADDDGVWVDDDEEDDNNKQSSDVNETQQPQEDDSQSEVTLTPSVVVRGTHGYEVSPDDLMVYPG